MGISPSSDEQNQLPRNAANWAPQTTRTLGKIAQVPTGALNNVEGRKVTSPLQGFGPLWQKTYRIPLHDVQVEPATVIQAWKEHYDEFWPTSARFYAPLTGIAPGEVAILTQNVAGVPVLSTGVLVLYADDESFTLMTPQGHAFAGWITFSSFVEDGVTIAQAQVLMRASDPLFEIIMRVTNHVPEDLLWEHTLKQLGKYFGVTADVQFERVCVDKKLQWSEAKNIWHNSAIRTMLYSLGAPFRWIRRIFSKK